MRRITMHLWAGALLLLYVGLTCAAAATVRNAAMAPSPRVSAVMKAIDKAKSLAELSQAVKGMDLSQEETKQLSAQIQAGPLRAKLQSMYAQTFAEAPAARPTASVHQLLAQKRGALLKNRADSLAKSRSALIAMKPTRTASAARSAARPETIAFERLATMAIGREEGPSATITEVTSPVVVGQPCTVRGERFGGNPGRVVFLVHRDLYYCTVDTWRTGSITFTVPTDLERAVGFGTTGHPATLWVKLAGGEQGPLYDVTIMRSDDLCNPVITSVTPTEITPGQTFIIRGRNFTKLDPPERPTVAFRFSSRVIQYADVEDYGTDFIQAKLPDDLGGLERTACRLIVTNDISIDAETAVTFVPAEEIQSVPAATTMEAACHPYLPAWLSWMCLFGERNQYTLHDFELKNGWVVEDSVLHIDDHGGNCGAYFVSKPDRGWTNAKTVVEVWADAYALVYAGETLFIKGPRGVAYQ